MINSKKLIILRSYLKDLEEELYEFSLNSEANSQEDEKLVDSVFGSLDFAKDLVETMVNDAKWEQKLIADNETLHGLWKEYKMVRDLIGSDTRCT